MITNAFFEQQVRDAGLDFVPMGTTQEADQIIADRRLWHPTKSFACIVERAVVPNIERLYRIIQERKTQRTVVAASGLCFGARIAQEKLGVPLATVHLQPSMLRSLVDSGSQGRIRMDATVPRFLKQAFFWIADRSPIDSSAQRVSVGPRVAADPSHLSRLCSLSSAGDWIVPGVVRFTATGLAAEHPSDWVRNARRCS